MQTPDIKAMNILFVGRSVFHFSYYESIIRALIKRGHRVTVLFDEQWSAGQPDNALRQAMHDCQNLKQGWIIRRTGRWRNLIFCVREMRSVMGYLARSGQSAFYLNRWLGYLPSALGRVFKKKAAKYILRTSFARALIAGFEHLVLPDRQIVQHLQEINPDAVIGSPVNMRFSEELEYIKAAKKQKIPTAIPVLSWDNLTTKGIYHVLPDLILAWNQEHVNEAINVHGASMESIVKIGSPFFDKWFDSEVCLMPRDVFYKQVGLNPKLPFVVYLGSSRNIAKDETWIIRDIVTILRNKKNNLLSEMQIVVRPHPANADIYKQLDFPGVVIWPRDGQLPESRDSQLDFYSTIKHSVAAIGINTSGMVDAVIIGKPVISVIAEQYSATQMQAEHFKHLLKADVLQISKGPGSCVTEIERILNGEVDKKMQRIRFIREFVRPYGEDFSAGEAAAVSIEGMVAGKKSRDITLQLKNINTD